MAGRYGVLQSLLHQSDYRLDLLLRAMEDETTKRGHSDIDFATTQQAMLSRLWVISSYETLRTLKSTNAGRTDTRLQEIYKKFKLVRIPIAKLEIADTSRVKEPIPLYRLGETMPEPYMPNTAGFIAPMAVNKRTGSIGWNVINYNNRSSQLISRVELSDNLLSLIE